MFREAFLHSSRARSKRTHPEEIDFISYSDLNDRHSPTLVSCWKAQAEEKKTTEARKDLRRPAFLEVERKQLIWDWFERRAATGTGQPLSEMKEQIVIELE
jgi:hypothetical protein